MTSTLVPQPSGPLVPQVPDFGTQMGTQSADNVAITGGDFSNGTLGANGPVTIVSSISSGSNAICTASLSASTNTVLATVTGLSLTLAAGGTYRIEGHLTGTAGASGGLKVAFGGTATATSSTITAWDYNGTTINAVTTQTTWGSAIMANTAAYTDLTFVGSITVAAGGTILLQAAQNASNGTATTVLVGSTLQVARIA